MQVYGDLSQNSREKFNSEKQSSFGIIQASSDLPIVSDVFRGTYDQF